MSTNSYKMISAALFIILFVVAISSFFLLKNYVHYRTRNPEITYSDSSQYRDELIFHWKLDGLNNNRVQDSSKNIINGTVQYYFNDKYLSKFLYAPPTIVTENNRKSLSFTGKQRISAGNKPVYNADQFTIATWIWQENDDTYMPTIMAKSSWHGDHDAVDGWWLCTTPGGRFLEFGLAWGNGETHIKSGYKLPLKEWHHVAVTIDRNSNEIQFYIDGKPYGDKHINVPKWISNWNHDLFIAGYDGSQQWPWVGKIDDVRFYASILTDSRVASIYSEQSDRQKKEL